MGIDTKLLTNVIEQNYSIQIKSIKEASRGFIAETFWIVTNNNDEYFVKLINEDSRYLNNIETSLPILEELNQSGISFINYPIKTNLGTLSISSQNYRTILFNYIDSVWTSNYDKQDIIKKLCKIHSFKPKNKIGKGNFEINFKDELLINLKKLFKGEKDIINKINVPKNFQEQIYADIKYFDAIRKECKNSNFNFVLTHGDAWGNILKDKKNNLFIIDWDDILLAPAERDLWFVNDQRDLLDLYLQLNPDYKFNELAYKYYLFRRYLDDLSGFLFEIYKENATQEDIQKNIEGIIKDCFEWLLPKIRIYCNL